MAFSGAPSTRCSPAQTRQAPRQPISASSQALRGQPTVLAKPATSVMPVMAVRDRTPYSRTSVANAASYRPDPMATPSNSQAASRPNGPWAMASATSPAAKTPLVATSTERPPCRSMARPAKGPTTAATTSAAENAANTVRVDTPRSRAIALASMAGR